MANLEYRFNEHIEEHRSEELERIREYARQLSGESMDLEIGSNRGRFLYRIARRRSETFVVGLENRKKYAEKGQKRLDSKGVENAELLWADAKLAVPVLFDKGQLDNIYLPFPDPWWKTRHRKRRIVRSDFLEILVEKMAIGGVLWIRTDVGPFASQMREVVAATPGIENASLREVPDLELPYSTRQEHIIREALPVHRVDAIRIDDQSARPKPNNAP